MLTALDFRSWKLLLVRGEKLNKNVLIYSCALDIVQIHLYIINSPNSLEHPLYKGEKTNRISVTVIFFKVK